MLRSMPSSAVSSAAGRWPSSRRPACRPAGATVRPPRLACPASRPLVITDDRTVDPADHHELPTPRSNPASRHRRRGRPARAAPPAAGTVTTCFSVRSCSRALTNWPGHSGCAALAKVAFSRSCRCWCRSRCPGSAAFPVPARVLSSPDQAATVTGPFGIPSPRSRGRLSCGSVNTTAIGWTWVIVMMPAAVGCMHEVAGIDLAQSEPPSNGA